MAIHLEGNIKWALYFSKSPAIAYSSVQVPVLKI